MKKPGRKSSAELATIGPTGIENQSRPEPSAELTEEAAEIWKSIVTRHPADWFAAGSEPVLAQLCRHIVAARQVGVSLDRVADTEPFDMDMWTRLLALQDRESARIAQLSTKLRLTPQSRYTPQRAANRGQVSDKPKLWE